MRPSGFLVLMVLVVLGLGGGAALYQWQRPRSRARAEEILAGAPLDPEQRLESWIEYIGPQIQNLLYQYRVSAAQPWLVTHTFGRDGGAPEVWGIPMQNDRRQGFERDGLRVIVRLEEPRLLARVPIEGGIAPSIPDYPPGTEIDPTEALRSLVEKIVGKMRASLAREIEGAHIEVVIGSEV